MNPTMVKWKADETVAVGKGAAVQQFAAKPGSNLLTIDVAPWGEGHLKVNGREVAHVNYPKDRRRPSAKSKRSPIDTWRRT